MARFFLRASLLIVAVSIGPRAEAQQFQYAAKFVIGQSNGEILAPGRYFTAINVHNPGVTTTTPSISKRFVTANPGERVGVTRGPFPVRLDRGQAMEIDTRDIFNRTNTPELTFLKGFVVITSNVELDVVGVYTASGPSGLITTMHMERVPARRLAATAGAAPETTPPAPATPD